MGDAADAFDAGVDAYAAHCSDNCDENCQYCADEVIECPACSRAGGADRGVYHLPPACSDEVPNA